VNNNNTELRPDNSSPFDVVRRVDEDGEYWSARELMPLLGYAKWQRFEHAIDRAISAAKNTGTYSGWEFSKVSQPTSAGNLGPQERADYLLSRYAAYLVAVNGDPSKPEISAARVYFATKTREADVIDMHAVVKSLGSRGRRVTDKADRTTEAEIIEIGAASNELRGKPGQHGAARGNEAHTYIVEFSDGSIKAGYSAKPYNRIAQHAGNAACFGLTVVQQWVSRPHREAKENEESILAWCRSRATSVRKAEYFTGIDFGRARRYASRLPMTRYTDTEFKKYATGEGGMSLFGPIVIPQPRRELSADFPEEVSIVSELLHTDDPGARWVLSNETPRKILHDFLQLFADSLRTKDDPRPDGTVSLYEWIMYFGGKYQELVEPIFFAAEAADFQLADMSPGRKLAVRS
jgi:predicted GIY-YIG superfamily endonuclease